MRRNVLLRVLTRVVWFTFVFHLVPLAMSVIDGEQIWFAWLIPALLALGIAVALERSKLARSAIGEPLRRREGLLLVTAAWLVFVTFTAIAYYLSDAVGGIAQCIFESMSGYTTTGATVVTNIEALPRSILLMRSFSHWIGGMGIIVLSVAILPEFAVGGMQLVDAESSGLDSEKLVPRVTGTARRLWALYFGVTALQSICLLIAGMGFFDAVNHSMATIATGGFSTKNLSVAGFDSVAIEVTIIFFMFISGLNFVLLYRAIRGRTLDNIFTSPEARIYTQITILATFFVSLTLWAFDLYPDPLQALRYGAFQVVSILTTTGFGTADFDLWPDFLRFTLVLLMLIGGCAGSTAGGSKVVRLYVVMKHANLQLSRLIRPRIVKPLTLGDRPIGPDATASVLGFYWLYIAAIAGGAFVMTVLGMDLVSGVTASISAMNSIGPGLGTVGAARNFADVPNLGLLALSFGMLLGRLEIYTVLVLFVPRFWRP